MLFRPISMKYAAMQWMAADDLAGRLNPVGIDLQTVDLRDGILWISRQIQRVSDNAIGVLTRQEGLRKSEQMHKVRLSQANDQMVAENAGQSPEVLMAHDNEGLDCEMRALSRLVEDSFYPQREVASLAENRTGRACRLSARKGRRLPETLETQKNRLCE